MLVPELPARSVDIAAEVTANGRVDVLFRESVAKSVDSCRSAGNEAALTHGVDGNKVDVEGHAAEISEKQQDCRRIAELCAGRDAKQAQKNEKKRPTWT